MAIETNSSIKSIIQNHDAKSWSSKIDSATKNKRLSDVSLEELGDLKPAKSFTEMLTESLSKVNQMQTEPTRLFKNSRVERVKISMKQCWLWKEPILRLKQ